MDMQAYEWIVTALAEEIVAARPDDAEALIERLRGRLGYASADPGFGQAEHIERARIDLVERLGQRVAARRRTFEPKIVRARAAAGAA